MRARYAFAGAAILAVAITACGGGGGGGTSGPPPTTQPTPTQTPTGNPTTNVTLGSSATQVPFPSNSLGLNGSVNLPSGTGSATLTASVSPPSGTVAVQARSMNGVPQVAAGNTAVLYVAFTATQAVTMNGIPGFTATAPAAPPSGTAYFEAYYDSPAIASPKPQTSAWVSTTTQGIAGTALSFAATSSPTITLAGGQTLYLAVYYGGYLPPINVLGCVGVNSRPYQGAPMISYPINNGDQYAYTGTLSQTISRSQPCPQPTATANAQVSTSVLVTQSNGTTQERTTETDTYPTNTTSLTTVATVTTSPSGSNTLYLESGESSTDGNGNNVQTTYSPSLQFAQSPDAVSNHWTGVAPASVNQYAADGTTYLRSYNPSSGVFYTETDTIPGGKLSNVITSNADGSGVYDINHGGGTAEINVQISKPSSNGNITFTIGTQQLVIPSWLPSPPFYSDATNDLGPISFPSKCGTSPVPSGATYEHLQRKLTLVDPVLGFVENETVDSYDANSAGQWFGPVCAVITDTQNQYYDWSLTTPFLLFASGNQQPVIVSTLNETLTLGSGYKANTRASQAQTQAFNAQLTSRLAGIRFIRQMQKAQSLKIAAAAFRAFHGGHL